MGPLERLGEVSGGGRVLGLGRARLGSYLAGVYLYIRTARRLAGNVSKIFPADAQRADGADLLSGGRPWWRSRMCWRLSVEAVLKRTTTEDIARCAAILAHVRSILLYF